MSRSAGLRFFILCCLVLLMFIPLFFVGAVIDSRSAYSREAIASVGRDWGGPQVINGPQIVIPVEGPVTRQTQRETVDPRTGAVTTELVEVTEIERKNPITLSPDRFDVAIETQASERRRGIFVVPVFTASSQIDFDFDITEIQSLIDPGETVLWDQARLVMGLTDNRALRGAATLTVDGAEIDLAPRAGSAGITADLGDPRDHSRYALTLGFNGAEALSVVPVGRNSQVTITSDWPHPSFDGAFLPDSSAIYETGFGAEWTIPHLARTLPLATRSDYTYEALDTSFGVQFYQPNDFYQKAYRAARYGILFIALTFLTVFLIESRSTRPVHPVQYILIGLAQSIFVLLMVAYAEQIGFGPAYALSAGATIGLLVLFGATGLRLGRRTWALGAMLVVLYTVLYLILRSADYALLAGSTLAFAALAGTVIATRNEDWYGPERPKGPRRSLFGSRTEATPEAGPQTGPQTGPAPSLPA